MVFPHVQQHVDENGQIEIVRNTSRPSFGIRLDPLFVCGANGMQAFELGSHMDQEDDEDYGDEEAGDEDNEDDDDEDENETPRSIDMRDNECRDDEVSALEGSFINEYTYHPALKTAVLAEGQEAMWMEDEVSTVASVLVKQVRPLDKPKPKNRFPFRQRALQVTIPEAEEVEVEELEPQKVHVKTKKLKKTVVLLPQQGGEGTNTLVEANIKQEAAMNMVKARKLLNQALVSDGTPGLEESENMAKAAFALAAEARRLMSKPEVEPDLEDVLSVLAERGEQAATMHQRIVFSQSFASHSMDMSVDGGKKPTSSFPNQFARRALQYLESILPTNVEREFQESVTDEILPVDSISTLGFKTDTFEYQMNPAPSQTKSFTNMDLMSISSLNEILDGPEIAETRQPSPRQVLPVIEVQRRAPREPTFSQIPNEYSINDTSSYQSSQNIFIPDTAQIRNKEMKSLKNAVSNSKALTAPHTLKTTTQDMKETFVDHQVESRKNNASIPLPVDTQVNPKKKWGLLSKLRKRGKSEKKKNEIGTAMAKRGPFKGKVLKKPKPATDLPKSELQDQNQAISTNNEKPPQTNDSNLPTIPSKSFDTDADQQSRMSRYHIDGNKSDETSTAMSKSTTSSARNSASPEEEGLIPDVQPDWDETLDWQNPGKSRALRKTDHELSVQRSLPLKANSANDWDETHDPKIVSSKNNVVAKAKDSAVPIRTIADNVTKLEKKQVSPIVAEQQEKASKKMSENFTAETPNSEMKDMKKDVQSVSETSIPMSDRVSVSTSGKEHSEGTPFSPVNIPQRKEEIVQSDHTTVYSNQDSLINFVISPRRADIITPGGSKPFEAVPRDEPSKIHVPKLHRIGENQAVEVTQPQSPEEETNNSPISVPKQQKPSKFRSRLSGVFGSRKKMGDASIQREESTEKDIEKAISDGNMKAFEANLNAEDAPSTIFSRGRSRGNSQKKVKPVPSALEATGAGYDKEIEQAISDGNMKAEEAKLSPKVIPSRSRGRSRARGLSLKPSGAAAHGIPNPEQKTSPVGTSDQDLEQAVSNAVLMAEAANVEAKLAPSHNRKSHRPHHSKGEKSHESGNNDLVDAIRRQAGLERKGVRAAHKESGDAPGVSLQVKTRAIQPPRNDPPKENDDTGYRVLAPTPRKREDKGDESAKDSSVINDDKRYDQRRITELLYGCTGGVSAPKATPGKNVYIGDLIQRPALEKVRIPTEVDNEQSHGENGVDHQEMNSDVAEKENQKENQPEGDVASRPFQEKIVSLPTSKPSRLSGLRNWITSS